MGKHYTQKTHLHTSASPLIANLSRKNQVPEEPGQSTDQASLDEETGGTEWGSDQNVLESVCRENLPSP